MYLDLLLRKIQQAVSKMAQICCRIIFCTLFFSCGYCYIGSHHTRQHLNALERLKSIQLPTTELNYYVVKKSRREETQRNPKNFNTRRMKSEEAYIEKLQLDSPGYHQFFRGIDAASSSDNHQKLWDENAVYSLKDTPYGFPYFQTSRYDVDSYSKRMSPNSQINRNNIDSRISSHHRYYGRFHDRGLKPSTFHISQDKVHSDNPAEPYKMVDFEKVFKVQRNPVVPSHLDWRELLSTDDIEGIQEYNREPNPKSNRELFLELLKRYRTLLGSNMADWHKQVQSEKKRLPDSTKKWNDVNKSFDERQRDDPNHSHDENFRQHILNSERKNNEKIQGKVPMQKHGALSQIKDVYNGPDKISEDVDLENDHIDHFKYQINGELRPPVKLPRKEPLETKPLNKTNHSNSFYIHSPDNEDHLLYSITREKHKLSDTKPVQKLDTEYIYKELLNLPEKLRDTKHVQKLNTDYKEKERVNLQEKRIRKLSRDFVGEERLSFPEKRTHTKHTSDISQMSMTMAKNGSNHGESGKESNHHKMKMKMDGKHMDMEKMKRLMEGYKYHVMLDITSKLMFCWNVNYTNKTVSIRVTCQLSPDYWFGVGFSDYGEITDADMVVFWNDPVDTHHLQDSYTNSNGVLFSDLSQDYTLHKARTEDGLSILEYTRPFDTCDEQDYLLDNGTTHIVYFISKGKPATCVGKDVRDMRHGFQRVQLLKPDVHLPPLPTDVWTFEITAPNVTVPGKETTYWWYITTLPKLHHKQHIVRYEGVIQKENEDIVHHIEVFHCVGSKHVKPYSGPKVPEGKMSPTSDLARCRNVIGAWAMGAEPIIYPEEAGSPIGGTEFSPFVLLEVHYHNPHLKTGHVDGSGIRFYVTPTLRKYDMGIMELGLEYTDKMSIPPKQDEFTLTGYCIAECTQLALPKEGINIFASQLHTHLTGKRVWTKHIRDGRELPEVNRDNHYSPHFQEVRVMPRPVNILPGDALITECVDSTNLRSNVTYGGFSITEEMCVNYIHYYPKVNLEVCKSSISDNALQSFFYFMQRLESVPIIPSKGIKYNYDVIPWFPLNVKLLDYVYQTSPISMQCNQSNGERFPGIWEGVESTKILKPMTPAERECNL